jgi:arabinogalactan endo-1,4-beta-galactosidase
MFSLRKYVFLFLLSLLFLAACQSSSTTDLPEEEDVNDPPVEPTTFFYAGADISYYPIISQRGLTFRNRANVPRDFLQILLENGINTARLRLWHSPATSHASFDEVEAFSAQLKSLGFKVWLTVHYSDTWADPGNQQIPAAWQNASFDVLKDSVYNYTAKIMDRMAPDLIQIGNEIDPGMLLPVGDFYANQQQFLELMQEGIKAVRDHSSDAKIMIHKANPNNNAVGFFNTIRGLDYDIIGISYYPRWHGQDLNVLRNNLSQLAANFPQDIMIAETAYPFTLGWNDWTNNIIGSNDQIIFPQYPATLNGQQAYLAEIKSIIQSVDKGVGLGYWGAEWVAYDGTTSTNGSPWENQALFDFDLKATPAIEVFKED